MKTKLSPAAEAIREAAEAAHAAYPQYAGHWDGWEEAKAARPIKVRGLLVATKGATLLVKPGVRDVKVPAKVAQPYEEWPTKPFRTFYSIVTRIDTSVPAGWVT